MQNPSNNLIKKDFFWQSVRLFTQNLWKSFLQKDSCVIDATCGNGYDALFVAKLLETGRLYLYDIQEIALQRTKILLKENDLLSRTSFFHASHETFQQTADLVIYNLGYLPGSNQKITTDRNTVLKSVKNALSFAKALSITCYPGHDEGKNEEKALTSWALKLDPKEWTVCYHRWLNRKLCPSLLWITKPDSPTLSCAGTSGSGP